jgi:ubiquinone/menaquinone biosynthesis C-methylase UbiE
MEPRLQRRIQRYGWDLAAAGYEALWHAQLAPAQAAALAAAMPVRGERVLDVACGTGLVSFSAAHAVGPEGRVSGVDLSGQMTQAAGARALAGRIANVEFRRMDGEALEYADASFDVALCALGLMYMPDPERALREMRRVLVPGGRLAIAVWGERRRCGWSSVFPIVDAEVSSEVCPLFFQLGQAEALAGACRDAGLEVVAEHRIASTMFHADAQEACDAAFAGGPVALAWSRFSDEARARAQARYLESIEEWREAEGYRIPVEFVVLSARTPA